MPYLYEFNGAENRFTNGFDPEPRARNVFAFHKSATLAEAIVAIPSEEFGRGNGLEQEITYCTTDSNPVEMVVFKRSVVTSYFFKQMEVRGARVRAASFESLVDTANARVC